MKSYKSFVLISLTELKYKITWLQQRRQTKNGIIAGGPFKPVAAASHQSLCSFPCESGGCEELQMALSKPTTAGTRGKGDWSSWGSTRRGWGEGGGKGAMRWAAATLSPFVHCATVSCLNCYSEGSDWCFANTFTSLGSFNNSEYLFFV